VNQPLHLADNSFQCYATASYPCSYLANRLARSQVVTPSEQIDDAAYARLLASGFRRSGTFVYRPHCDQCQACQSIRIPVNEFAPTRSQKRAWRQHAPLQTHLLEPRFSQEHYDLYIRYQRARHAGGGMDVDDAQQYREFLVASQITTSMVEFRSPAPDHKPGPLRMVSVIDRLDDALSAVYTFYEPDDQHSYGTFNVLWQIEWARSLGLTYLYLGYWIQVCNKMSYKSRFNPHELLVQGRWHLA